MPISEWFKDREQRRYTPSGASGRPDVPDGVWSKCVGCKRISYAGDLNDSLRVCPHCGFHDKLPAADRIALLADEGTFQELDPLLASVDPLGFCAAKPYTASLEKAKESSGLPEAVVTGEALLSARPVVLGAFDFRFVGASMGSAVGEKVSRAFEHATDRRLPVVLQVTSGGARMQEGMLSLMQMAKTAASVRRHSEEGLAYVSVLCDPTLGGVTASFASLADVLLAEPGALIGFAGQRVIEQTIRESLPKRFRSAEYMAEHGMIDAVVGRDRLRETVALLLEYLAGPVGPSPLRAPGLDLASATDAVSLSTRKAR